MSNSSSWTLGRTLPDSAPAQTASIYETTSLGYGNYNAAFLSVTMRDWHGLTARSNLTWSHTLGTVGLTQSTRSTTVLNPWDLHAMYGPQPFDIHVVYNLSLVYQPNWFHANSVPNPLLAACNFA